MNGLHPTVPGVALAMLLACGSALALPHAELTDLGSFAGAPDDMKPRAVNVDNRTVIVEGNLPDGQSGTQWQAASFSFDTGAYTPIPAIGGDLRAASYNAETLVGWIWGEDPIEPGRFSAFGFYYEQGDPAASIVPNDYVRTSSNAWGVSPDGRYIVGYKNYARYFDPCCPTYMDAFIWDLQTMSSPLTLPDIVGGVGRTSATGVSADGGLIAGFAEYSDEEAVSVIWTATGDSAVIDVPGSMSSRFMVMSPDGRYAAGFALMYVGPGMFEYREDAFIYDLQEQAVTILGQTPQPFKGAIPTWISGDGKTVVGTLDRYGFYDFPAGAAFIWTEAHGLELLADHIIDHYQGIDPSAFLELETANGASPDGSVIVGVGIDGDYNRFPYAVRLGVDAPSCPADLTGDGVVDADDFFLFLQLFAAGDSRADFNNDGVIDADDFFAYLSAFAAGC
ncbi:MAG: hypothetical protein JJU33_03495 [Phycisphaerales bacterium]|nr:hypothetical protein [Phycisphaerales bacterium]